MKPVSFILLSFLVNLTSCGDNKKPDLSAISVQLQTQRFEKDLFAMDTNNLAASLDKLYSRYPGFFRDYATNILGIPPANDSGVQTMKVFRQFLSDYRPVYDSVNKMIPDIGREKDQLVAGLRHVKYYFPSYKLPSRLITFIGPMDAFFQGSTGGYGDVITQDGLAVGLQLHLGSRFSMYNTEMGLALFPAYISRKFSREYIPVNAIKNIIDDLYPDQSADKALIEQMIEKGKRIYLADLLLPDLHDTLKIGYTKKQLDGCYTNEGLIWNHFVTNGLVYNNDPSVIKNYIGDAPNTPEFGEGAPGYIGLFVGWQIVNKYMSSHEEVSPDSLMKTDAKRLFEESRYRPK
jgi:hypothetical protein